MLLQQTFKKPKHMILDMNCVHAHFVVIAGLHEKAELKKYKNQQTTALVILWL